MHRTRRRGALRCTSSNESCAQVRVRPRAAQARRRPAAQTPMMFLCRQDLVAWLPRQLSAPVAQIAVGAEPDCVAVTVLAADGAQVRAFLDVHPDDVELQALAAQLLSEIVCALAMLRMRRPRAEVHP
jgi:hypothetical protein